MDPNTIVLSILVPVYNELATIKRLEQEGKVNRLLFHEVNRGKGAAIRTALAASTGDVVIVQDADLEYDPQDWPALLDPLIEGKADAVFGSRFLSGPHRVLFFWHYVGNKVLTTMSNVFTNLNLTDMETCYKAIRGELARSLHLTANRFGFEPEVIARLAKRNARIYEVPISYSGRTYAEGKKIGWKDGVAAFWHIAKYNLFTK
jgi:glycosyltransferase involved in cell wall biosynthesis